MRNNCNLHYINFLGDYKMKTKIIHCYTDYGHGWAKVELKELLKLGIVGDISRYSYYRPSKNINGKAYVYLEEDQDIATYTTALTNKFPDIKIEFKTHHTDKVSKIRSYNYFDGKGLIEGYEQAKKFIDDHFKIIKVGSNGYVITEQ